MHHQNEQMIFIWAIGILDASLVHSYRVSEKIPIQVRPELVIISQIWIRDHVTKLLLEGMFGIVQTRHRGNWHSHQGSIGSIFSEF